MCLNILVMQVCFLKKTNIMGVLECVFMHSGIYRSYRSLWISIESNRSIISKLWISIESIEGGPDNMGPPGQLIVSCVMFVVVLRAFCVLSLFIVCAVRGCCFLCFSFRCFFVSLVRKVGSTGTKNGFFGQNGC